MSRLARRISMAKERSSMAGGWNSGSDREAMLRRVAIVLTSLPAPIASKLLGSMGEKSNQAVRRTMSTLTDVDPLERQRAIQAFKVMFQRQPISPETAVADGDALQIQTPAPAAGSPASSRVVPNASAIASDTQPLPRSPLSFLSNVEDRTLARLLTAEHPQTIAFVLASISPEQAARVLPQLGARLQQDTMSRIGRMGEIPDTAVAEVAEHFRSRLQAHKSSDRHALGRRSLEAILAAMPSQDTTRTSADAERRSASNDDSRVASTEKREGEFRRTTATQPEIRSIHYPASEIPALDLTHRLRIAEQTWPDQFVEAENGRSIQADSSDADAASHRIATQEGSRSPGGESRRGESRRGEGEDSPAARQNATIPGTRFDSTDGIHQHLIDLSPSELCQALGKVDTRDAMLALCGLPVQVADAALAVLPRSQAKAVRIKMNSLGSLHLREIDRAKEKVAEASLGMLPSPSLQRPLAA